MWERKPRPPVGEQGMSKRYRDDPSLASVDDVAYSSPRRIAVSVIVGVTFFAFFIVVAAAQRVTGDDQTWIVRLALFVAAMVNFGLQIGLRKHPYPSVVRRRRAGLGGWIGLLILLGFIVAIVIPVTPLWVVTVLAVLSLCFLVWSGIFYVPYDYRATVPAEGSGS